VAGDLVLRYKTISRRHYIDVGFEVLTVLVMKNYITDVSEEHIASIFRVEKIS
jgi:hypothetical protein